MDYAPHPQDHEARALWHLELLGCFEPGDAVAPWVPPPAESEDDWDEDYDGEYMGHFSCWRCGGEGFEVVCIDDICHGLGYCMHGDGHDSCPECHGEGWL